MFSHFSELKKTSNLAPHSITTQELVSAAIIIICNTGLFNTECDEWEKKKSYDWAAFQKYFMKESLEVKKHTSAQLGYNETAAAVLEMAEDLNSIKEILQATRPGETVNAALSASDIKDLICKEVNAVKENLSKSPTHTDMFKKVEGEEGYTRFGKPNGITAMSLHQSPTCKKKVDNHNDTATLYNRKGGSDKAFF